MAEEIEDLRDLRSIRPPGGPWKYGFETARGRLGSFYAVTSHGEMYQYMTRNSVRGVNNGSWRCSFCKQRNRGGWVDRDGTVSHGPGCRASWKPALFEKWVHQWAYIMVVNAGQSSEGAWRDLVNRMGMTRPLHASWVRIGRFVDSVNRQKRERPTVFEGVVQKFAIRMVTIRVMNRIFDQPAPSVPVVHEGEPDLEEIEDERADVENEIQVTRRRANAAEMDVMATVSGYERMLAEANAYLSTLRAQNLEVISRLEQRQRSLEVRARRARAGWDPEGAGKIC